MMQQNFWKPLQLMHDRPRSKGREGGGQPCNGQLLAGKAGRGKESQTYHFCRWKTTHIEGGQQQELFRRYKDIGDVLPRQVPLCRTSSFCAGSGLRVDVRCP